MGILGLTDPWIIAAYAGCILSTVFCVVYSIVKKSEDESDD